MSISFAFYGRVSTEDQQDPESSRSWQLQRARQLIEPQGGIIVTEYFDIGQSRSIPWKRRKVASRLLEDLRRPDRGFSAIVIGEPARAFYGNQFGLTFPVLTHYNVGLWVPEVGGLVDPGSEAHDLVMTLFGGMSKGERMRIKTRVRSAMSAQTATEGRFLGGRPPYGYQLVDAGPHPHPGKAAAGLRQHRLEPDPETALVVKRIFAEFLDGYGYYAIAERLSEQDILSPSGRDRQRNSHRHGLAWGKSAVRAILMNPKYTGYQVWNRQRREEVLLDIEDVGAGHDTVMRWNAENDWVWSTMPTHEALVDRETFDRVQALIASRGRSKKARKPSKTARTYLLRGCIRCDLCGRYMQGAIRHRRVYYRCQYPKEYANSRALEHPPSVYVREEVLLTNVDPWLGELFSPASIEATCEAIATAAQVDDHRIEELRAAQKVVADCKAKMRRFRAAIEAGTDPVLVTEWITETTARQATAEAKIAELSRASDELTAEEVRMLVETLGGFVSALASSDDALRAKFYEQVGLAVVFDHRDQSAQASIDLGIPENRTKGGPFLQRRWELS